LNSYLGPRIRVMICDGIVFERLCCRD
jgi:hypothetical protein